VPRRKKSNGKMRNMNGGNNNWGSQWSANNKGGKKQKRCGADSGSCHDKCQMLNTLLRLFSPPLHGNYKGNVSMKCT